VGARRVRLFIDECVSPLLARRLNAAGLHEAVHPLDVGRYGEADHKVLERCLAEDRIIVTENARDFLRLLGQIELHPAASSFCHRSVARALGGCC
jgi:predicted nuclease of predicted toxin-antitoxin system